MRVKGQPRCFVLLTSDPACPMHDRVLTYCKTRACSSDDLPTHVDIGLESDFFSCLCRPVQKQYVVETKFVGEEAVAGGPTEVVGNETREVDERIKQAPAGDRCVPYPPLHLSGV